MRNFSTFSLVILLIFCSCSSKEGSQLKLRSQATSLSIDSVNVMIEKYKNGPGFHNRYEVKDDLRVVIDHASGLMWRQYISRVRGYKRIKIWLMELNYQGYADFHDWRLPTLEEALSLLETEKKEGDFYIESVFHDRDSQMCTADFVKNKSGIWVVDFVHGGCVRRLSQADFNVRAVRPIQSSEIEPITIPTRFRTQPIYLTNIGLNYMIKKYDFFEVTHNPNGRGFDNQFEVLTIRGNKVVIDRAAGLMWQQSGSSNKITFARVNSFVSRLYPYAGFYDWRLPTLDEVMSLVEKKKNEYGLNISSVFDSKQHLIWTADRRESSNLLAYGWVVDFNNGSCQSPNLNLDNEVAYIRAVRSEQLFTSNIDSIDNTAFYKTPRIIFRNQPTSLSVDSVKFMLKKFDFYCEDKISSKSYCNPNGKGFDNQFELRKNNQVVYDKASGLVWQKIVSSNMVTFNESIEWIQILNQMRLAGYNDWRLPTLEEAMSLIKPEIKETGIDSIFDIRLPMIWTADSVKDEPRAWVVSDGFGCAHVPFESISFVRAVRSAKPSE